MHTNIMRIVGTVPVVSMTATPDGFERNTVERSGTMSHIVAMGGTVWFVSGNDRIAFESWFAAVTWAQELCGKQADVCIPEWAKQKSRKAGLAA